MGKSLLGMKDASYPGTSYEDLKELEELAGNCPIVGISIYIKQKDNDFREQHFVYLKIKCLTSLFYRSKEVGQKTGNYCRSSILSSGYFL